MRPQYTMRLTEVKLRILISILAEIEIYYTPIKISDICVDSSVRLSIRRLFAEVTEGRSRLLRYRNSLYIWLDELLKNIQSGIVFCIVCLIMKFGKLIHEIRSYDLYGNREVIQC